MRSVLIAASLILSLFASGAMGAGEPSDAVQHPSCKYCGMDRAKFAHSRVLIDFEDGTSTALCSLHCTAVELATAIDKTPKAIRVGDYGTKELVDAETAQWVLGGGKPGVMTRRAKWAFATAEGADAFVKENGGKKVSFEEALKAEYEDMYEDTKAIRERRKMRRMKEQGQSGMKGGHGAHNH